ncbi:MAG TPA: hypothetical protein VGX91_09955 [Candidatus Cybelea sp.]|jgi:hypothetical protein|nr:hypothetical protein [Candidatus Cybelea sp.]
MSSRETIDRIVDLFSVALISAAALLTALCGYQSGRWGEEQTLRYNVANGYRVQSAEAAGRANALTTIDVTLFLNYVTAIERGDARTAEFIFRRFRPEMRPAMDAWLATRPFSNPKAPLSPFTMPEYSLRTTADSRRDNAMAGASFVSAQNASRSADAFLLLTVLFATVSFLAGVSTKMVYPSHAIVVVLGFVGLIYGIIRLVDLPYQ